MNICRKYTNTVLLHNYETLFNTMIFGSVTYMQMLVLST